MGVRNSMVFGMMLFMVVEGGVTGIWQNEGLWFGFMMYRVGGCGFLMM